MIVVDEAYQRSREANAKRAHDQARAVIVKSVGEVKADLLIKGMLSTKVD